uniref:Elongation of very long chain fatty acids protein n=1 Tax=Platynereis dumerilii TaxID=6359 RepID=A0AA96RRF4_PLADU|nr:elongation of very long chain fatty acids protein elovl2/5 [Platynereis dumerilii]
MAQLAANMYDQYLESLKGADPHSRDWLLIDNSPTGVIILTALYLAFIKFGPRFMKNREPFKLQNFMVFYNLGLVALSVYMVLEMWFSMKAVGVTTMGCAPYNDETRKHPGARRVAAVMWWYFFSKAIEFIDTILMVLRKKEAQITFLHVFHHASMFNIWWWVVLFIPGGCSWFGSCLNSLVHVFMYSYYGLAAIPSLRGKLWWKKYLTKMQLIQFVITFIHTNYVIVTPCDFPFWGKGVLGIYMVIMFTLFSNFYIQSYLKTKERKEKAAKENGASRENGVHTKATNGLSNGYSNHSLTNGNHHEKSS